MLDGVGNAVRSTRDASLRRIGIFITVGGGTVFVVPVLVVYPRVPDKSAFIIGKTARKHWILPAPLIEGNIAAHLGAQLRDNQISGPAFRDNGPVVIHLLEADMTHAFVGIAAPGTGETQVGVHHVVVVHVGHKVRMGFQAHGGEFGFGIVDAPDVPAPNNGFPGIGGNYGIPFHVVYHLEIDIVALIRHVLH